MNRFKSTMRRLVILGSIAVIAGQLDASAIAQSHPHLFRQRPVAVQPERNASVASIGDVDHNLLASNPERMTIVVPGKADLLIDRHHHDQRSADNMVWRGQADDDPSSKVTLTLHNGILLGHIQSGNEIYALRPGRDGRTIIEKIDTDSFNPEWGHDHRTHGHDKVPPRRAGAADLSATSNTNVPASAAATTTTEIVLMSVYTPQARAAAGGLVQIQAQIQAAVDQANTAFINSNMIARYRLAHTAEVAYDDSGNIDSDLNWVTGNAAVASLRNTHSADMVSLITENGGGYCGIGWVQRNPGAGFA
ncbi:MAG TPA: zinc-dependent metalloprotease family protein, partial [Candidatus Deferrimicrobium sp.]|nr:zinc-dependent metalloprotease family protein [Candidatus Deferrimicrobium sp.]